MLDEWQTVSKDKVSDEVEVDKHARPRAECNMDSPLLNLQALTHGPFHEEYILGLRHGSRYIHHLACPVHCIVNVEQTTFGLHSLKVCGGVLEIFLRLGLEKLSRDAVGRLVVLDRDADARLVHVAEQPRVAVDLFALDDLLSQMDELVVVVGDHNIADRVMALDVPHGPAIE